MDFVSKVIDFWNESVRGTAAGWNLVSNWLRALILFVLIWPFAMFQVSLIGSTSFTAFFGLLPAIALIVYFFLDSFVSRSIDPLLIGLTVKQVGLARDLLQSIRKIIFVEIIVLFAVMLTPFHRAPQLVWPLLVGIMVLAIRGESGWFMRHISLFVTPVIIGIFALLFFGGPQGYYPKKITEGLEKFRDGKTNVTQDIDELFAGLGNYPDCADAKNVNMNPFSAEVSHVDVKLHPQCFSGMIITPISWPEWHIDSPSWLDIKFANGDRAFVKEDEAPHWKKRRGVFKLRGEGTATISIYPPDSKDVVLSRKQ